MNEADKLLPEVIYIDKLPKATEHVVIDGIEYTRAEGIEKALHIGKSTVNSYRQRGLPFVPTQHNRVILYPVAHCREWLKDYNAKNARKIEKIEIDGELYYNSIGIAKHFNYSVSKIERLRFRGLPAIKHDGIWFHPVKQCEKWKMENTRPAWPSGQASLCNFCDNAYVGKCSWFTNYTPVEGWEAIGELYESGMSYNVRKCPNFVPDPPRKGR